MGQLATIDFENRSVCSLKKHGSWIYAKHKTTETMCMAYALPGDEEPKLWHMAHPQHLISESPPPLDLFEHILAGGLVEAHNAFYERMIWMHIMVARHGWPKMPHLQWRCSASKASAVSLPRGLGEAAKAAGLPEKFHKDMGGHALMMKMCKPRKPLKADVEAWMADHPEDHTAAKAKAAMPVLWHETEKDIVRNWRYCEQDVRAERALSIAVPDLIPQELRIWQMDQDRNENGVKFDLDLAHAALEMVVEWKAKLNKELFEMTGVTAGTLRLQVKAWLLTNEELDLPDTRADTLEHFIEHGEMSGRARRVCEIMREVNRTSTSKYQTMINMADPDDWRVRDLLMYWGANTGRWAGKGVQVHNLPARNLIITDFEEAAQDIKTGDMKWCEVLYGDVMKLLSHALRGAIIPAKGCELIVADYSAIEARCVLWEAGAQEALAVFLEGGDIYCDMASVIYGFIVTKKNKAERQFGKQAILGLGYGMGYLTFLLTCRDYNIHFSQEDCLRIMGREELLKYTNWVRRTLCLMPQPTDLSREEIKKYRNKKRLAAQSIRRLVDAREDVRKILPELALMKYTVDLYRARYPEVKKLWYAQEEACIKAVQSWENRVRQYADAARKDWADAWGDDAISFGAMEWETKAWRDKIPGPRVEAGKFSWYVLDGFLYCELPSGRRIAYNSPQVKMVKTSWGEDKPSLRYMSVDGVTRKWVSTYTYGGKVVENQTQAVARDFLAEAELEVYENHGDTYLTIMSVHDEPIVEVAMGEGSVKEFEELLCVERSWSAGCPIAAEGERLTRYKK